jgi:hypothetical protein
LAKFFQFHEKSFFSTAALHEFHPALWVSCVFPLGFVTFARFVPEIGDVFTCFLGTSFQFRNITHTPCCDWHMYMYWSYIYIYFYLYTCLCDCGCACSCTSMHNRYMWYVYIHIYIYMCVNLYTPYCKKMALCTHV